MNPHKISWYNPAGIDHICFIGKDVFALHDNVNIFFYNISEKSELMYCATTEELGHGVECMSGHQTENMFVFAELTVTPRLFLLTYPGFEPMCVMKDDLVEGYLAVGLTDLEQVVALSSFPNYQISVWCWRTNKKLIHCDTNVTSLNFIFSWNLSQTLIFHGWDREYYVWEIVPCYKTCTHISRKVIGVVPMIVDVTWSPDGNLYCIDDKAVIYHLMNDGMGVVAIREWSSSMSVEVTPKIIHYKDGFIVYGPDEVLKYISKSNKEWNIIWDYTPEQSLVKVIDGTNGQVLCISEQGHVVKIHFDEKNVEATTILFWQRNINFVEILKPSGNTIFTISDHSCICLWSKQGQLMAIFKLDNYVSAVSCSPVSPVVAMCVQSNDTRYGVWIINIQSKNLISVFHDLLTSEELTHITWSESGNELATCCFKSGEIFFLRLSSSNMEVVQLLKIKSSMFDCFLFNIAKTLQFMILTSDADNDFNKTLVCYKFNDGNEMTISGSIHNSVKKIAYFEDCLLTMNCLENGIQIYNLKLEGSVIKLLFKNNVKLNHEIATISMRCENNALVTWGLDGVIFNYSSIVNPTIKVKIKAKHHLGESIRLALFDTSMRYMVCVTHKGTLSLHNLIKVKSDTDSVLKFDLPSKSSFDDVFVNTYLTWIQKRDIRLAEEESKKWADKQKALIKDFIVLQKKLVQLLEENMVAPPLHQLPLNAFNLHVEGQQHRAKEAALEREAVRVELEEVIKSQDTVAAWVKEKCWDPMNIVQRKIFAIFRSDYIDNYSLFVETHAEKDMKLIIQKFRQFESTKNNKLFMPWINNAVEESKTEIVDTKVSALSIEHSKGEIDGEEEKVMEESESFVKFEHQLSGTSSHLYITPADYGYPQLLTQSALQMKLQAHCIEENIRMLKLWFNKQFDNMMDVKQKELTMIEEKDKQLNFVISELNILSQLKGIDEVINIYIGDPRWHQDEKPEKLITVEEDEVDVTPYISPSQIVIPPPDLGPKDDFKERALMIMMDGVLEKLWHEEIKKPIPVPECMLKDISTYTFTEDDLKEIVKYEKAVEFRNEERETYNKMLRAEYVKLSSSVNETITRFNQKIKDFHLLKLKVESAIGQEELKLMRLRNSHLMKLESYEAIQKLKHDLELNEMEFENAQKTLEEIAGQQSECHSSYEALVARDRALDKNFKSSFSESSSIIADLCYKYFKKRPKWQQRASMTPGVLYELAQACVTKEKPRFLHHECMELLKGLDQMDLVINMPAAINNETAWFNMCKLRRMKIELEIKIKAVLTELTEIETASSIWHKRVSSLKMASQKLTNDLLQIRHDIENATKNIPLQLIMKYGYVEVELTGHDVDYKPAVLIKLSDIDAINSKILEAGHLKLKAMRATTNFKKNILTMEWEHAKLRMKIRHLEEDIYHLERLKVTKEIREYLHAKIKGETQESNVAVEKQIEITRMSFNNHLKVHMRHVEELELKVGHLTNLIQSLNSLSENLKVKVSEKHHLEDPNVHKRKVEACKKRMETLVFRSKLLAEVKKQYVAIVLLQTDLELQRLRTYPTLTSMKMH